MQPTVRIMMATYNGGKYLREQIDSIISQTYRNWSLIIQDDGSTDDTWMILEEYADKDFRIKLRLSPEAKHGAYYNFHSICNQEKKSVDKYDYYMFSDQDDLWDTDKIDKMINVFTGDGTSPLLIYGDMRVINTDEEIVIDSIVREQGLFYKNAASLFLCHNIYGCNLMMNRAAFEAVPIIDTNQEIVSVLSHDNLYAKFAGAKGEVRYLDVPLMTYRRHGGNVTAVHQYGFGIKRIIRRAAKLNGLARDHARTYKQSLYATKLLLENGDEYKVDLNSIESCIRSRGFKALKLYRKNAIDCGNKVKNISRCTVLFLGKHLNYL